MKLLRGLGELSQEDIDLLNTMDKGDLIDIIENERESPSKWFVPGSIGFVLGFASCFVLSKKGHPYYGPELRY